MRFSGPFVISLSLLAATLPGCADTAECSPDQRLENGYCVDVEEQGTGGTAGSGGSNAGGRADAAAPDAAPDGATPDGTAGECSGNAVDFGTPCTDDVNHSECGCPADFCAIDPSSGDGYCTVRGCVDDPSVCPEGWGCLDLSRFQPGLPSICTQP